MKKRHAARRHFMTGNVVTLIAVMVVAASLVHNPAAFAQPGARGGSRNAGPGRGNDATIRVTIAPPQNGTIEVSPELPDDRIVEAGTVLTVTASPADGFVLDSCYYSGRGGMFGGNYEFMTPEIQVTVNRSVTIGASFIDKEAVAGINVTHDVEYAKPGVKTLKYDVFSPEGAENLPCVVIIHGGGWSSNTEDIMRGLARELSRGGDYVVFSIDYRWIGTGDGDEVPNTMANLIEDVYGAIAHIYEHAAQYGGDPTRIAVTGDSAGGHLSACAIDMIEMIGDGGFGKTEGLYQYKPTYMPEGKSVDQVREELLKAIQVAAPSYGVFDGSRMMSFLGAATEAEVDAVSPIKHIPNAEERAAPQFLTRGTNDGLIRDADVQAYADALEAAGHHAEYVKVEGAGHAFFDWKPDARTKATFAQYGVPYAAQMKAFFDKVLYSDK